MSVSVSKHYTQLVLVILLISISQSINIILHQPVTQLQSPKKCYISTVYKQQRLLVQLQLPIFKSGTQIILQISQLKTLPNQQKKIIFTQAIKQAKYKKTIQKQSHNIQQLSDQHSFQYQTCLYLKTKSKLSTTHNTQFQPFSAFYVFSQQQNKKNQQSYLVSLKLLTNFSHILQDKRSQSSPKPTTHQYTKQHLLILQQKSSKLLAIAKEQVKIHRENEKTQMKTERHVTDLQNSIYSMSLTQSGLLVAGSLMHINLMRTYLKGNKLIV